MEAIAQIIHEPIREVYPYSEVIEAIKMFVNMKQKDDEAIVGFMERFSQQKNILQSHLGNWFFMNLWKLHDSKRIVLMRVKWNE